jgi:hypothetical protein
VLDTSLAPLFTQWPRAWWGPGDEHPARLDEVRLTALGLDVMARGWWGSAPALDQMITLGEELADRLRRAGG